MTRFGQLSGAGRGPGGPPPVRAEPAAADERPFAEIRRNLDDALRIFSLHRWAFFVPFCIVTSGAFVLSLYFPRTYSATTAFERRNDPIMVDLPMMSGGASFKYFRSTTIRDLTSLAYMIEVVDNLGLTDDLERRRDGTLTEASAKRRNALASSLGSRITVGTSSPNEHVDIIRLDYKGPDPTIGAKLLDEAKNVYIRRTMARIHEFLQSQRDYFLHEQAEAMEALKLTEREETRLQLESPYAGPRDPAAIPTRISQLEIERKELQLRRREYEAELSALEQMLAALGPQLVAAEEPAKREALAPKDRWLSPAALRLAARVHEIDAQVAELRHTRGMTDEHPEIKTLLKQRWELTERLEDQQAWDHDNAGVNGALETGAVRSVAPAVTVAQPWLGERARLLVQAETQKSKIRDVDIRASSNELELAELRTAKESVYDKQDAFADVAAQIAKARQRYATVSATLSRIEPAIKAIEQDRLLSFYLGQSASGSSIPINPRTSTIFVLAVLAGVVAGVVFAVLAEVVDHVYRSSGQVARSLGLPILDAVDVIVTSRDRRRLLVQRAVLTPLLVAFGLGLVGLTGSLAYFSIQQPWTYQRIKRIPEATLQRITLGDTTSRIDLPSHAS